MSGVQQKIVLFKELKNLLLFETIAINFAAARPGLTSAKNRWYPQFAKKNLLWSMLPCSVIVSNPEMSKKKSENRLKKTYL